MKGGQFGICGYFCNSIDMEVDSGHYKGGFFRLRPVLIRILPTSVMVVAESPPRHARLSILLRRLVGVVLASV